MKNVVVRSFALGLVAGSLSSQTPLPVTLPSPNPYPDTVKPILDPTQDPSMRKLSGIKPEVPPTTKGENDRLAEEIRELKRKEKGVRRFASDLFDVRALPSTFTTEGGVSEEYVLGTGDQLLVNVFGSATFEMPTQVDGRGELLLPRVGTVKVAGMSLARARAAVQSAVSKQFSAATVDVGVIKLREVRIQVLGEVYRSGSYLVPSLCSLVNVLSLAGGPTAQGSYREIRVIRGGKVIHVLDLYPLRAEGLGNQNFYLQNGDHLFVPLAHNTVVLEGAFSRVESDVWGGAVDPSKEKDLLKAEEQLKAGEKGQVTKEAPLRKEEKSLLEPGAVLRDTVGDQKLQPTPKVDDLKHRMVFELLAGETAAAAIRFAGGLHPWADSQRIAMRRRDGAGRMVVKDVLLPEAGKVPLQRGDILSAFSQRETVAQMISLTGHARTPGLYARRDGLRVGQLLREGQQVLPDTYLSRGEVVRTLDTGETRFLVFDVKRAMEGDPTHDLLLEDRDRVELFRNERMRLQEHVVINGAMLHPGKYPFHAGMRASDLLFRAGVPLKSANRLVAELARSQSGKPSLVLRLDLQKLLSDEGHSPVGLQDEGLNPVLQADDQISVFEKPEFRLHRTVKILGQVERPGTYTLDAQKTTLSSLVVRAGGLTDQAMPSAGMFFRKPGGTGPELTGVPELDARNKAQAADPSVKGVGDILERLSEAKFYSIDPTGTKAASHVALFKPPVLHGLSTLNLNRMVVDFSAALKGDHNADPELMDGDEVIIPRKTDAAIVIGEVASPFAYYKVLPGMDVADLLKLAGNTTRNADAGQIRLLKANGQLLDSWVRFRKVEPGDVVLVPQRIRRDSSWQENMQALTPLALIANAIK